MITNKELKYIKTLHNKKGRKETGKFIAEGVRLLEEAVKSKFYPEKLYYCDFVLSERADSVLKIFKKKPGISIEEISKSQLETITQTEEPQGIVAVFKTPDKKLTELYWPKHRKLLLCDNISDPGNLGTLIRSAAAFEFDLVILTGNCAEPYSPKVVRSSAGGIFVPEIAEGNLDEVLGFVASEKMLLIATDLKGKTDKLPSNIRKRKIVLAIGSESEGLSVDILRKAPVKLRIEHSRKIDSLNAAIAGSILMSKLYK